MDTELMCNFKKCRKGLSSFAWVTSCSHIFCNEDGVREFEKAFVCPACNTELPGKFDIVRMDLNPSEQYKSMVLAGQRPEVILEICSRAMTFWTFQVHQETMYQEFVAAKARERCCKLEQYYEQVLQKAKHELNTIKTQMQLVKKDLEESRKKVVEVSEKLQEKKRQHQKLLGMYESLRRKYVTSSILEGAEDGPSKSIKNLGVNFALSSANEIIRSREGSEGEKVLNRHPASDVEEFVFNPIPEAGRAGLLENRFIDNMAPGVPFTSFKNIKH